MKPVLHTIIAFALIGSAKLAMAQQLFVLPNKGGGEITLTGRQCVINGQNQPELREAYTWSPSSSYEKGCWAIIDGNVHILFLTSKERRVYRIEDFEVKR